MRRFILTTALAIAAIEQPLLLGRESSITPAAEMFANTEIIQPINWILFSEEVPSISIVLSKIRSNALKGSPYKREKY